MKKSKLTLIGLYQALGLIIYVSLTAYLMSALSQTFLTPPGLLGSIFILFLLVFSAAVCGLIVFGYPAYLVINKRAKEAILLLVSTLLYCLGIIAVILVVLFSVL
ncbi:hypothetical protein KJ840_02615 [Patescibacteria group bacterium]|nr:hypothetical protein [Patescibacteria group bacterium]